MEYTWLSYESSEEWNIFESLFNNCDVNMILGIDSMPFSDFLRILYIVQTINLKNLELDILRKYYMSYIDVWDEHFGSDFDPDFELLMYIGWLTDFWMQIEDQSIQEDYIKRLALKVKF